jgi:rod shape-determining protein MreC
MRDLFRLLFRIRITLLFLLLLGTGLVMVVNGNEHHRAQAISSSNATIGRLYAWRSSIVEYAGLREENLRLAQEIAELRNRDARSRILLKDSTALVRDSLFKQQYRYITARVINGTVQKRRNYITLDKGSLAGLHKDMGVVGAHGIVGVVREVSPHFALVISVLSNELESSVQLKRTGHFGLLKWDDDDLTPMTIRMTDVAKHVPVAVGDTVVTSGGDGVFPAGIMVGVVSEKQNDPSSNYHTITLTLSEDLSRSGYVHVVDDLLKLEQDTLQAKASPDE